MHLPCQFGRYTLVERIACGGTAEVYRAVFEVGAGFRKTVAVKVLLPAWWASDELRRMLEDEARVLCRLTHQAIVQVHELGSEAGLPFLTMEYVDGLDGGRLLARLIREGRALPVAHVLYVAANVLSALDFAHRSLDEAGRPLGLVHRDISPSNLLLSWSGEVKVTDFGIAKGLHRSDATAVGQLRGKYAYMAPEQARGEPIDARADLFALGLVLAELALGHRACEAATDVEVLARAARGERRLDGIDRLPPELRAILLLALAAEPAGRYQTAAEMLADVRRAERALNEWGGSLELAGFLCQLFPGEERRPPDDAVPAAARGTRVLTATADRATAAGFDDGPAPWRRAAIARGGGAGRRDRRMRPWFRAAAAAVVLAGMPMVPKADGSDETRLPALRAAAVVRASTQAPMPAPPAIPGVVAIDSVPSGIRGTLTLGATKKEIVTPVTESGIDVGPGLDGRIELAAPGFQPVAEAFRLTSSSSAFVKDFQLKRAGAATLSVSAAPWGLVSVAGYASARETPASAIRVKEGTHTVRVTHPPTGREVSARVTLGEGQARRCHASFGAQATIRCK